MTVHVGVIRDADGLRFALSEFEQLERKVGGDRVLANMLTTARLIAASALMREESRGAHYRSDFPTPDNAFASRTFITLDDVATQSKRRKTRRAGAATECLT